MDDDFMKGLEIEDVEDDAPANVRSPDDAQICALAAELEMTPAEVKSMLASVSAPLAGFRTSLMTGEMLLQMAEEEHQLALRAMFNIDAMGRPRNHIERVRSFDDFDPENKEGELRRKWANEHRKNRHRYAREAQKCFTQSCYFRGLMSDLKPVAMEMPEEELSEEERLEAEKASALAERLVSVARRQYEHADARDVKALRKEAKKGLREVSEFQERVMEEDEAE